MTKNIDNEKNEEYLLDADLTDFDLEDEEEDVCETCGGTGEITTMERVYPNEPHLAPVGSAPCPDCQDY